MKLPASFGTWASGWFALLTGGVRSFRGHVLNSFATNVVGLLIAVGTASVLARSLGTVGRGEFAAITGWPTFLGGLAVAGLPAAAVFHTSRSPSAARSVLVTTSALALPIAVLAAATFWYVIPLLLHAHGGEIVRAAQWYAVAYAAANILWLFPLCTLQGVQAFRDWNLSRLLQPVLWALLLAGLAFIAPGQPGAFGMAQAASFLAAGVPILFLAHRATSGPYTVSRALTRPALRYGAAVLAASLPQQANRRLDQLLMAVWVDPRTLGLYAVAVTLSNLLTVAAAPVAQVLLPRIAGAASRSEQRLELGRAIRSSLVVYAVMTACLMAVGPLAIRILFGAAFSASIRPMLVLAPASVILSTITALEETLNGLGRPRDVLVAEGVALAVTSAGLAVTLPSMPLMGAAVTSLVAYAVALWILAVSCRRALGISASELLVPTRHDVARVWGAMARPTEDTTRQPLA